MFGMVFYFPIGSCARGEIYLVKPVDHFKILQDDIIKYKLPALVQRPNCISMNLTKFLKAKQNPLIQQPIDCLQGFRDDLKKYKPNAPWITESFMSMNLEQFSCAFKRTIKILTVPQKRWFYFSNSAVGFDLENHWAECLWQCMHFEQWMTGLSMDKKQLVFKDANHPKIPFIKILTNIEQLKLGKNLINKYYQFYAFYIDCLSNFFCEAIYACYGSFDDSAAYRMFLATAKKSLSKMKQNLQILGKSKLFYPNYKLTLDNYKNILALVESEKIKTYQGSFL